jgi:hypothetical protein
MEFEAQLQRPGWHILKFLKSIQLWITEKATRRAQKTLAWGHFQVSQIFNFKRKFANPAERGFIGFPDGRWRSRASGSYVNVTYV